MTLACSRPPTQSATPPTINSPTCPPPRASACPCPCLKSRGRGPDGARVSAATSAVSRWTAPARQTQAPSQPCHLRSWQRLTVPRRFRRSPQCCPMHHTLGCWSLCFYCWYQPDGIPRPVAPAMGTKSVSCYIPLQVSGLLCL